MRRDPLEVTCPTCGAEADTPCLTVVGRPMAWLVHHGRRLEVARARPRTSGGRPAA